MMVQLLAERRPRVGTTSIRIGSAETIPAPRPDEPQRPRVGPFTTLLDCTMMRPMPILDWATDQRAARIAARYCPIKRDQPAKQYAGRVFNRKSWEDHVVQPSLWPSGFLLSSPDEIIRQFQTGHYTQALA